MNSILWMILETVASLLASACMLRVYAQWVRLSPHNPLAQFMYALTDWLVRPLTKLIAPKGQLDLASLTGGVLVALIAGTLFLAMASLPIDPLHILMLAALWLVRWTLYLVMGLVILMAVISLVNPHAPLAPALNSLTEPLLRPFRRLIPLVGNFDLSPLVLIIAVQIALAVIGDPRMWVLRSLVN